MKRIIVVIIVILSSHALQAQNNQRLWEKVEAHELKGEVKSASTIVDKLLNKARKSNDTKAIIKSFIYKSKFNLTLNENAQSEFIKDVKFEIQNSSFPTTMFLRHIYAQFLIDYYSNNRYKIESKSIDSEATFNNLVFDL